MRIASLDVPVSPQGTPVPPLIIFPGGRQIGAPVGKHSPGVISTVIERLLFRLTARLPCRLIDGEHGEPYLERYYLFGAFGWHAYVHRFVDSDPDRGLHDHPWGRAVSLVLAGGYDEIRPDGDDFAAPKVRAVGPLRLNFLRGNDFHRVVLPNKRPAWTLFMHGPRVKGWGFMQNGEFRAMARDGSEFRHRDWWKTAPAGQQMRGRRGDAEV